MSIYTFLFLVPYINTATEIKDKYNKKCAVRGKAAVPQQLIHNGRINMQIEINLEISERQSILPANTNQNIIVQVFFSDSLVLCARLLLLFQSTGALCNMCILQFSNI